MLKLGLFDNLSNTVDEISCEVSICKWKMTQVIQWMCNLRLIFLLKVLPNSMMKAHFSTWNFLLKSRPTPHKIKWMYSEPLYIFSGANPLSISCFHWHWKSLKCAKPELCHLNHFYNFQMTSVWPHNLEVAQKCHKMTATGREAIISPVTQDVVTLGIWKISLQNISSHIIKDCKWDIWVRHVM